MNEVLKGFGTTAGVLLVAVLWSKWSTLFGLDVFYAIPLLTLFLPLLMPTRKWLAGCVAFFGIAIAIVMVQHFIVTSSPDYTGSPGEGIGLAFLAFIVIAVGSAVGIRFLIGAVWARLTRSNR